MKKKRIKTSIPRLVEIAVCRLKKLKNVVRKQVPYLLFYFCHSDRNRLDLSDETCLNQGHCVSPLTSPDLGAPR